MTIVVALVVCVAVAVFLVLHSKSVARGKARSAECQSNLQQLSQTLTMYADDWGGKLPPGDGWERLTRADVQDPRLFVCPEDDPDVGLSYAINEAIAGKVPGDVPDPGSTVMLFDATHLRPSGGKDRVAPRHMGGYVACFADGHVSWERTTNGEWPVWDIE